VQLEVAILTDEFFVFLLVSLHNLV
jgi:hypothetical protein